MTRPPRAEAARLTAACALTTAVIGTIALAGWTIHLEAWTRLFVGNIHMLPITAATFIVAAMSLWMQRVAGRETGTLWVVSRGLALLVMAIGLITLAERVWGWNAGFDTLLFHDTLARLPYQPIGRMATNSAVSFALAGAALFLLDGRRGPFDRSPTGSRRSASRSPRWR